MCTAQEHSAAVVTGHVLLPFHLWDGKQQANALLYCGDRKRRAEKKRCVACRHQITPHFTNKPRSVFATVLSRFNFPLKTIGLAN